mgnify:CR=1 FL=1
MKKLKQSALVGILIGITLAYYIAILILLKFN